MSVVDIHSHLVPGVDDGANDVEAVLSSVERMVANGIGTVLTTPHIKGSVTHDPVRLAARLESVSDAWEIAAEALAESFPDVVYHRGHEILIDVPEPDLSDSRIRLAGTSFVLVEWPRLTVPPRSADVLARIREQGYRPIVAHPERYMGGQGADHALAWRDAGAYLQVNYGSLAGRYGAYAEEAAWALLQQGLVDYLASDFHGHSTMKIYKSEAWDLLEERDALAAADLLACTNPARVLNDQDPLPVPAVPPAPLLGRLRGMIGRRRRPSGGGG